ncbi:MAG: DUF4271 domain-containing protein [Weeksellaceae bacterium]
MQPILRNAEDFTWVFSIILGIGILFILLKFSFYKSFKALGNIKVFTEIEENILPFALTIHLILGCLVGICLYPFLNLPYGLWQDLRLHLALVIATCSIFLIIKFLINTLIFYFTNERGEFRNIVRSKVFYKVYLALILLIGNLLLYYSSIEPLYILYSMLGFFVITSLIEYYRQASNGKIFKYMNSYYFILYLCILEILPILYLYNHWYR